MSKGRKVGRSKCLTSYFDVVEDRTFRFDTLKYLMSEFKLALILRAIFILQVNYSLVKYDWSFL